MPNFIWLQWWLWPSHVEFCRLLAYGCFCVSRKRLKSDSASLVIMSILPSNSNAIELLRIVENWAIWLMFSPERSGTPIKIRMETKKNIFLVITSILSGRMVLTQFSSYRCLTILTIRKSKRSINLSLMVKQRRKKTQMNLTVIDTPKFVAWCYLQFQFWQLLMLDWFTTWCVNEAYVWRSFGVLVQEDFGFRSEWGCLVIFNNYL